MPVSGDDLLDAESVRPTDIHAATIILSDISNEML
jgi:hypothetical protein